MKKNIKGSTMIELLISVGIISLVLVGVAMSMMYSLQREALNRYRQAAMDMANEAVEYLSYRRAELGWEEFVLEYASELNSVHTYCFGDKDGEVIEHVGECVWGGGSQGEPDNQHEIVLMGVGFLREVTVENLQNTGVTRLKVTVTVSWVPSRNGEKTYQVVREYTKQDY